MFVNFHQSKTYELFVRSKMKLYRVSETLKTLFLSEISKAHLRSCPVLATEACLCCMEYTFTRAGRMFLHSRLY